MKKQYYVTLFLFVLFSIVGTLCYYKSKSKSFLFNAHIVDSVHLPKPNILFEQADAYKYAQDYQKADAAFKQLLERPLSTADSQYVLNQLAYIALAMNEDTAAAKYIQKLETHFPTIDKSPPSVLGDYFYNKGVLAYRVFHPKEAEMYFQNSLDKISQVYAYDHLKTAECLATLGLLHYEFTHTPDSAFLYLPKAFTVFQKNKNILRGWSVECLLGMSMVSRSKRRYDEATGYCEEALTILKEQPYLNTVLTARCLVDKARGVNMRRFKAAKVEDKQRISNEVVSYFRQSTEICPKNSVRLQECYQYWIRYNAWLDSLSDPNFKNHFWEKMADLEGVVKTQKIQIFGFSDYLKGCFYSNIMVHDSTIIYMSRFAKFYQKDSLHNRYILNEAYTTLKYDYEELANALKKPVYLDSALVCLKMNLLNYADDKDTLKSWADIIQPNFYEKVSFQFAPLSGVAVLFLKKYKATGDKKSLELASKIVNLIDKLLFSGITSQDDDAYDFFQIDASEDTYNTAIKAATIYYSLTKDKRHLDDVFRFGERVRSFLLYRDIEMRDTTIATPPQYLRDKISHLESEINQLKWSTEKGQTDNIVLMQKQNLREQLYAEMKAKFPKYYRLKVVQPISNIASAQSQLNVNQCFVQYTFSDSELHALFIRKKGVHLYKTAWDTAWQNKVYKLCGFMNGESKDVNTTAEILGNASFDVYKKIFPIDTPQYQTFMRGCEELIVSPDRQLNYLPFEALVETETKADARFNSLPYLVNRLSISYTPSWKIYETNHRIVLLNQPVIKAYTYDFDSKELKSAQKEFNSLQTIFGDKAHFAVGKEANSKYFMADTLKSYDILHLSLHAKSDPLSKYNNTIYFGPNRTDSILGFDLLKRRFIEKLVVLSACQSAFGKIKKGEGTYALSRIFLRAGVPHVVASLWSIPDVTTEKITSGFYENLINQHLSTTKALNQAKRQYIQSSDELTGHPRFWAGMVSLD